MGMLSDLVIMEKTERCTVSVHKHTLILRVEDPRRATVYSGHFKKPWISQAVNRGPWCVTLFNKWAGLWGETLAFHIRDHDIKLCIFRFNNPWMIRMPQFLCIYDVVYYNILCMNKFNPALWLKLDHWVYEVCRGHLGTPEALIWTECQVVYPNLSGLQNNCKIVCG